MMNKRNILTALCFLTLNLCSGQSPYHFNSKKEPIFIAGTVTLLTGSYYLSTKTEPLTNAEITTLDPMNVNSFDRFATEKYSKNIQYLSDGLMGLSFLAPTPLIFKKQIQSDVGILAGMYAESFATTTGLTLLSKTIVKRSRPFVYNSQVALTEKRVKDARHSFFSGHTSITTMNSFFFAKVFSDYFPESKYKSVVWTAAILLPAATGYARIEGGKHFPTDVITGYVVGAAIGYLVPHFHKKESNENQKISFEAAPNGVRFSLSLK